MFFAKLSELRRRSPHAWVARRLQIFLTLLVFEIAVSCAAHQLESSLAAEMRQQQRVKVMPDMTKITKT